jgi:hypothetical protein
VVTPFAQVNSSFLERVIVQNLEKEQNHRCHQAAVVLDLQFLSNWAITTKSKGDHNYQCEQCC